MRVVCFGTRHVTHFLQGSQGSLQARSPLLLSGLSSLRRERVLHSAATSLAQQDSLPGALQGNLQGKIPGDTVRSLKTRTEKSDFRDSLSVFAGWAVIAMGLALSLHASRSMIAGHQHALLQERDNMPVPADQLLDEA